MIINPYVFNEVLADVFGVIGDSNADGRGATIPVVAADTLYNWNGSSYSAITTQSVANDDNTKGSIWQNFATTYKSNTGRPVYLCNSAVGGSEFYPNGDNTNWYTSGTLYAAFQSKIAAALGARGATRPNAIFINLGINDYRSANSIADIQTGVESLFDRLAADFPNTPIVVIQMGRSEASGFGGDARAYDIRSYLVAEIESRSNFYMCCSGAFVIGVSGGYIADNLHFSQTSNDIFGLQLATWVANESITNKWARAVVSSCFRTVLSSGRTSLLAGCITDLYNAGCYMRCEYLIGMVVPELNDILADWTFLGYGVGGAALGFSPNAYMTTSGTITSYLVFNTTPSFYDSRMGVSNFLMGVKLRTRVTASGTAAVLMGRSDGTNIVRLAQNASNVNCYANNTAANVMTTTDVALEAGKLLTVGRNGGTEEMYKDSTLFFSQSIAVESACTQALVIGAYNSNNTISFPIQGTYQYAFVAGRSGFDLSVFFSEMEALIAGW